MSRIRPKAPASCGKQSGNIPFAWSARAVRARKQVPTTMWNRYSLRAQKGRKDPGQQPSAPAAADALRNTDDRPPTRAPMGPDRQPNGPNGAQRPRGGGGLGWITRLLVLFLLLILGYQLYVNLLVPNAGSNTIDLAYSDFIAQVDQGNVKTATIADDRNVTGTLRNSITYTEQGGTKVTSNQFHTYIPPFTEDQQLQTALIEHNVTVYGKASNSNDF